MLPKISLLEELRKGGYEASLITTFNAYLPFYEEVVLRRLVNAGVRHNVLLMDARQYAASVANHPPRFAGRRYTLPPIVVPGAFHPKLIILCGKNKGLVVVGSHNMTLAGFGFNRELTNVVRVHGSNDSEGASLAFAAWSEVETWLDRFAAGAPQQVTDMVRRVRDFAPWLKSTTSMPSETHLVAGRPGAASLWAQFSNLIEGNTTDVAISGAFFDQKLAFLQRVSEDLKPTRLVVGVDPSTVQIPSDARDLSGVSLVRASGLGFEDSEDGCSARYLHAKAIFVRQPNDDAIFACGSANPSRPAWLAEDRDGNVELMLVRRGKSAYEAATALGFDQILDCPPLEEAEWQEISKNQAREHVGEGSRHHTGLAIVEGDAVIIEQQVVEGLDAPEYVLMAAGGREISRTKTTETDAQTVTVRFPINELAQANSLLCFVAGELVRNLLLHHVHAIEEQARTGVQRRFKDALISLNTETPNIGLLIECIEKIIFSHDSDGSADVPREANARDKGQATEGRDMGSLAIDVDDIVKRKRKHRLSHSSDFAYLLDALIYHLRIQEIDSIGEMDSYGRSEEEQIGADDDEETESQRISPLDQNELLDFCHSKVRKLVNRMLSQIKAYRDGKQELEQLLIRLLGVLAVLRELRCCDGRVAWVAKGKTTVPKEDRLRLLEGIMLNLFEGEASLVNMESLGDQFQHSDDVARVMGLLVWLAWDCELSLDLKKPFMEEPAQLAERLRRNAIILALAQMMSNDEVVIDEARKSIGSLSRSELDWFKNIQWLATRCEALVEDRKSLVPAVEAEPGHVAIHKNIDNWRLRVVANRGGRDVSLIQLDHEKPHKDYRREYMIVVPLLST